MTAASLPIPVHSYLRDFVARRRIIATLRATAVATSVFLTTLLVACLVDRLLPLPPILRLAILACDLAVFALIIARPLARLLRRRFDWLEAARDVETCNPAFTQRLQTVVSQLIEDPRYRGSPQILDHLLAEITQQAVKDRPGHWIRWRSLAPAWSITAAIALLIFALGLIPVLGLPTLAARFLTPLAAIAPVTTTRISVTPGNVQLTRSKDLSIRARVQRLGSGVLEIYTTQDRQTWTHFVMQAASDDEYTFSMPVERDLWYCLKGGDALTSVYQVTVLRPPTVAEYRIRYDYPAYTGRGAFTVTSTDGVIEALVGTKVTLTLVTADPLKHARLSNGLVFEKTADPAARQVLFTLQDTRPPELDLEMTSADGLSATVKKAITLRALSDHKPTVRLLQPFQALRLHPRDLLPVQYQATDDYGITALSLMVQVSGGREISLPLSHAGDPRRQEGQFFLDLAAFNVHVGDAMRVELLAEDGAANKSRNDSDRERDRRLILIAPRSVDIGAYSRTGELRQASHFANSLRDELEHAGESLDRARQSATPEPERSGERLKVGRALARAGDAAQATHQSLFRAAARSESWQQTRCLTELADQCRVLISLAERLGSEATSVGDPTVPDRLRSAIASARQLASHLSTLNEGEQAAIALLERQNLRAPPATQPTDRAAAERVKAIQRAHQDIAAMAQELSLPPGAADLDNQLQRKVDAARGLIGASRSIDFESAISEWSASVRRGDPRPPPLVERLISASCAEALRPDSDPLRARDLQLAAHAAERLAPLASQEEKTTADEARAKLIELPGLVASLQREHRLNRRPNETSAQDAAEIRRVAAEARTRLAEMAGQTEALFSADRQLDVVEPEDLALQANVETARRSYAAAVVLDQRLAQRIRAAAFDESASLADMKLAMDSVKAIDQIIVRQEDLRRAANAPAPAEVAQLAQEQARLASEIARIEAFDRHIVHPAGNGPDSRQLGVAVLQAASDQLESLPQQLTAALAAIHAHRQARESNALAQRALAAALPETKAAATQPAQRAQRDLKNAEARLAAIASTLSPQLADRMARQLRLYEPESHDAVEAIATQLQPALAGFEKALRADDPGGAERASLGARDAATRAQKLLADAQLQLLDRDPLAAAKWLIDAARAAFSSNPPDLQRGRSYQDSAVAALTRAWHDAARDAAMARLAVTPGFRTILNAQTPDANAKSSRSIADVLPAVRQWAPLRQRQSPDSLSTPRETEPPSYLESLRLYFEGIYRTQK